MLISQLIQTNGGPEPKKGGGEDFEKKSFGQVKSEIRPKNANINHLNPK